MKSSNLRAAAALSAMGVAVLSPAQAAFEPFIGEINTFGSNFCPQGWAPADGRLLQISQNAALFSLLGTNFGGNGATNFALPDLRGRVVVGAGQGPGLGDYYIAEMGGAESVTLSPSEMPSHAHSIADLAAPPTVNVKPVRKGGVGLVRSAATGATQSTQSVGGGQPHENRQPYLTVTRCIALEGIYPPRP